MLQAPGRARACVWLMGKRNGPLAVNSWHKQTALVFTTEDNAVQQLCGGGEAVKLLVIYPTQGESVAIEAAHPGDWAATPPYFVAPAINTTTMNITEWNGWGNFNTPAIERV